MIKRFAYIALLLVFAQYLSLANTIKRNNRVITFSHHNTFTVPTSIDTAKKSKQQDAEKKKEEEKKKEDEKNKIKEIAKAKHQAKPEKVDDKATSKTKTNSRDKRPEGLERPPEIPRRNGN